MIRDYKLDLKVDRTWSSTAHRQSSGALSRPRFLTWLKQNCLILRIISNILDVDDVFVRRDLNDKYKIDKSAAEEFSDVYSFKPRYFVEETWIIIQCKIFLEILQTISFKL